MKFNIPRIAFLVPVFMVITALVNDDTQDLGLTETETALLKRLI